MHSRVRYPVDIAMGHGITAMHEIDMSKLKIPQN
jgi:hypothetical protein